MAIQEEGAAGPVTIQIGVCGVCHVLFMISPERQTSPCHGADPLAILATLTIDTDSKITGHWGAGAHVIPPEAEEEPAPAAAPPEEAPAEEAEEGAPAEELTDARDLRALIAMFLVGAPEDGSELRVAFVAAGAEPERAANAVGRLEAVREEIRRLEVPEDHALAVPDAPEAEIPPENT